MKYTVNFFENKTYVGELPEKYDTIERAREAMKADYDMYETDGIYMIEEADKVIEMYDAKDKSLSKRAFVLKVK